jgi:peptide/nickel transport system permease protein
LQKYIIRRLVLAIPTIWIVISLVFLAVRALPGDFVTTKLAQLEGQGSETRQSEIEGTLAVETTTHRVLQGQSLSFIAEKNGVEVEALIALNDLSGSGATPEAGQRLIVLNGTPLERIAIAKLVTVEEMVALNPNLDLSSGIAPAGVDLILRESVTIERLATDRRITSEDILNVNTAFGETNPDGDWTGASVLFPGDLLIFPTTKITEANIRHRLGVDRPLLTQYFDYLWDTVRLDFGTSFQTNEDSLAQVARFLPRTIQLGIFSLIIALVFSIPIGIISAIRQDGWMDYILRGFAILSLAAPVFWTATMLIFVVTPGGVFGGGVFAIPFTDVDARNIWDSPGGFFRLYGIPALAGGLAAGAGLMRITRSALLEVLRQDYLRTAWAKGLRERTVITRHAMKNAMIPVLSVLGLQMAALLGGTVVLEVLFTIPGMGQFLLTRIIQQDIPPIQTIVLIFATFTIAVNLLIDLSYAVVDPRIRYS